MLAGPPLAAHTNVSSRPSAPLCEAPRFSPTEEVQTLTADEPDRQKVSALSAQVAKGLLASGAARGAFALPTRGGTPRGSGVRRPSEAALSAAGTRGEVVTGKMTAILGP